MLAPVRHEASKVSGAPVSDLRWLYGSKDNPTVQQVESNGQMASEQSIPGGNAASNLH